MDPGSLIPSPDTIPAPWWVFEALGLLTFTIHLLLINVVLGGSLLGVVALVRGQAPAAPSRQVQARVPIVLALGINFGVAPLLFLQVNHGHLVYTSSVVMGTFWILVIPALVLAYYGTYVVQHAGQRRTLALLVAPLTTLLLLWIAFTFVNNMTLMLQPARWTVHFQARSGTSLNLGDPILWPRYLHIVNGSVAVAGLFRAVLAWWRGRRTGMVDRGAVNSGLRVFAIHTLVQMAIGLWLLFALPDDVQGRFLGADSLRSLTLILGIALGLAATTAALNRKLGAAVALLLATMLCMVLLRALLRSSYLAPLFHPEQLELAPQLSPLLAFLAVLLVGAGVVLWLVRTARRAAARGDAAGGAR